MRRVVVTGMGIVSSIGNTTQEVLASLHEAKSGIRKAESYTELGFRCQVHGAPTLNAEEVVDRRAMRFHGGGTAWNHVAMDQAILDSGLTPADISNERTGMIMGSGGPSTRAIIEAARGFDVDWMAGRSVGIFPLAQSRPEPVIRELETIFAAADKGVAAGAVTFVPVLRLNGVLAVANAHYELASKLLDAGADPNSAEQGWTALHQLTWVRKPGKGDNDPAPEGSGEMSSLELGASWWPKART